MSNEDFEKSMRINGFAQSDAVTQKYEKAKNACEQTLSDLYIDREKIEPIKIESIGEYINKLDSLGLHENSTSSNPIFFRVHANINYYNVPASLRLMESIDEENWCFNEFSRRYPEIFERCSNVFEKLVMMQHYGSFSRCLDLTESPLATLALACIHEGKWEQDKSKYQFATVTVFQAPKEDTNEFLKYSDSSTVSVLANCARMDRTFDYGHLNIAYKRDGYMPYLNDFLYFRDIVRRSVIVRAKQDTPRIYNQRGAFILVNANRFTEIRHNGASISPDEFTEEIIKSGMDSEFPLNVSRLSDGSKKIRDCSFKGCTEWDFSFEKIFPYSLDNKIPEFRDDPFDIKRFYFKKNGKQLVFFIPPNAKDKIRKQLELIGFGYDKIYPEPDTVFHEIVRRRKENI